MCYYLAVGVGVLLELVAAVLKCSRLPVQYSKRKNLHVQMITHCRQRWPEVLFDLFSLSFSGPSRSVCRCIWFRDAIVRKATGRLARREAK